MDTEKITDFVVYNFEKGIVALVILMSGLLVYSGINKSDITQKHDPERLATSATEVRRDVDLDHSEAIIPAREPEFDIARKQEEFRNPIKSNLYRPDIWELSKLSAEKERRQDPVLAKPVGIQATGVIASLAYRSSDGLYALADLEPADPLEVIEAKPKRQSRRNRRASMMDEMGGMEEGGMDMEMDMDMDMMMMEEMGGGMGGDPAAGPVRKLAADNNEGMTAKATQSLRNGDEEPPVPGIGLFIAGTAAIPHKELIDAYQKAFAFADAYDPAKRDAPLYIGYQVQRADVTTKPVDQLVEDDWILRDGNDITIKNAALYWSGFAPEVVPDDYWAPGVTMWIPPVVLDRYTSFATNPLIPSKTQRELDQERILLEAESRALESGPVRADEFEIDVAGGQSRSFGGMGMDMGMEMDMDMEEDMGMGMGMDMGMGMGGSASGMTGKPAEENPVDYKLLRFYDFAYIKGAPRDAKAPRRGRKYVYRIRFAVNDPNFPQKPELQPKGSTLDPDAYKRYIALSADAEQNQKRNFKRWSEWSDISAPTSLPQFDHAVFGNVKANKSRRVQLGSRSVMLESEPPKAEVVASEFDPALGVFIPTLMEATEGTVLSKKVETADVVDPITLEVKKTTEKTINSAATIIDVEGGAPMDIVDDDTIFEPGLFLMMDSDGNLQVKDSTEQQKTYRIKSFAEERGL